MMYRLLSALLIVFIMSRFSFAAAIDTNALESMTVTASRNPVPRWEAGSTLTIIDRIEIERRQTPYVTDLLRGVPGLSVNQQGGVGKFSQVRVRGAEANHVLVMIDGVEGKRGSLYENSPHLPNVRVVVADAIELRECP